MWIRVAAGGGNPSLRCSVPNPFSPSCCLQFSLCEMSSEPSDPQYIQYLCHI